ncbi:MAG: nicotinate-nucleotide adenylyltransferase [Eggerthellaceae bacterium]|jgi:nicotinate-nucleotide adenylyltransferase
MKICERFNRVGFDDRRQHRLGIFGGTFDPIHIGHLAAGEHVRESLGIEAIVFMPAGEPVFKRDRAVTPGIQRLEMCRLAVAGNPHFDVSSLEIDRGGDTYTIDTLREVRAHYPDNVKLFFITGADAIMGIGKWRSAAELGELAQFVALTRPGYDIDPATRSDIERATHLGVEYQPIPGFSVSSSMIRRNVTQGRSIRYLVSDEVREYIRQNGLYRTQ